MKALPIKITMVGAIAVVCGGIAGLLFSLLFCGSIPSPWRAEVYLSDTEMKMKLRF